jgi:hypothetical protein
MPEKAPLWARLAAVWWEGCVGGGKEKSSKLRSNKAYNSSNKRNCKNTNAHSVRAWMHGGTV